jgi:hypothetical protein
MPIDYRRDPREGEYPSEIDLCAHNQHRDACGKCWDDDRERARQEAEHTLGRELGPSEAGNALLQAVARALAKIDGQPHTYQPLAQGDGDPGEAA